VDDGNSLVRDQVTKVTSITLTRLVVQWSEFLTTGHEVPGSISLGNHGLGS
jgi:hypothetical protein